MDVRAFLIEILKRELNITCFSPNNNLSFSIGAYEDGHRRASEASHA